MTITIDRAGRIVLPKVVRDRFNLVGGTELEVEAGVDGVSLRVANREPSLVEKDGVLVHHGSATVPLDVAGFINREREARALRAGEPVLRR